MANDLCLRSIDVFRPSVVIVGNGGERRCFCRLFRLSNEIRPLCFPSSNEVRRLPDGTEHRLAQIRDLEQVVRGRLLVGLLLAGVHVLEDLVARHVVQIDAFSLRQSLDQIVRRVVFSFFDFVLIQEERTVRLSAFFGDHRFLSLVDLRSSIDLWSSFRLKRSMDQESRINRSSSPFDRWVYGPIVKI